MESIIHAIFTQVTDGEQKETEEITTYNKEVEEILQPLKGTENFDTIASAVLEAGGCGQALGFVQGFKCGVLLMLECMKQGRVSCVFVPDWV